MGIWWCTGLGATWHPTTSTSASPALNPGLWDKIVTGDSRSTRRKHFRMPQSPSSHGPARDGTRGSAVKGRRLAALATARSSDLQKYESRPTFLTNTSRYPKQNCLVWSFPDFTPLILLTTALPVRRWVRSIGGTTWQGKPEVAQSEKKLGNDNLSTKNPIWNGMGSNLGPRDDRPADNRLSHGTRTEACTWSHLFKLGSHRTENPLCLRYRHQNVSAIIGTNFCLFAVSYAKHYHNIGRKQTTS